MSIVSNSKHDCLIAEDWNIYLLKYDVHLSTESFVNNLHANLLIPVITRPTKFSEFSSTLIDNILTNKPQDLLVAGALICDISDHLSIFFVSKEMQKKIKQNYFTTSFRVMTPNKMEDFKTALTDNDWTELNVATDVTAGYELFINRFLKMYDDKLPITLKRTKPYSKNYKPWITSAILKSIYHKQSLYKKSLQDKPLNPI